MGYPMWGKCRRGGDRDRRSRYQKEECRVWGVGVGVV